MPKSLPKRFYKTQKPQVVALPVRKRQLPSFSLTLPTVTTLRPFFSQKGVLTSFLVGFLLTGIGVVSMDINQNMTRLTALKSQEQVLSAQATYWKGIVGTYKGYRDGYYQLAVLEYQLGRKEAAYQYIRQALAIDPTFQLGKAFAETLEE